MKNINSKLHFMLQMKQSCVSERRNANKSVVFVSQGSLLLKKSISI